MADLTPEQRVTWLRERAEADRHSTGWAGLLNAADLIERQQAENAALKKENAILRAALAPATTVVVVESL